jgi:hypothetical protein
MSNYSAIRRLSEIKNHASNVYTYKNNEYVMLPIFGTMNEDENQQYIILHKNSGVQFDNELLFYTVKPDKNGNLQYYEGMMSYPLYSTKSSGGKSRKRNMPKKRKMTMRMSRKYMW